MHCRIRDLDVPYEAIGSGPPVVMLHGMGVDHRTLKGCMEPVLIDQPSAWRRIYFDLPGMGQTPGPAWIRNSDDVLGLVLSAMDEILGSESFALVGESYGGYLARGVVRARPGQVLGVLLLCPLVVPRDRERDVPPLTVLEREPGVGAADPEAQEFIDSFLTRQTSRTWPRFRDEMLCGYGVGDGDFQARVRADEAYALSSDPDTASVLYDGPSLILAGRQDALVGYRDAWRLLDAFPRASYAVLDMAGHGLQIEQPDLFRALVLEWLARIRAHADESDAHSPHVGRR